MLGQGQPTEALHWTVHGHKHSSCSAVKESDSINLSMKPTVFIFPCLINHERATFLIDEEYLCKCMQLIWCILVIYIYLNVLLCCFLRADLIKLKRECMGKQVKLWHWHSFSTYFSRGWLIVVQMYCRKKEARTHTQCTRLQRVCPAGLNVRCCWYHTQAHSHSPSHQIQSMLRAGISGFLSLCRVCTHSFTFVPPLSAHSSTASGHSLLLSKDIPTKPLANSVGGFRVARR